MTEFTLRILGLDYVADTLVGGSMLRGISGGQKKRVTTGEMIVGPCKTLMMDGDRLMLWQGPLGRKTFELSCRWFLAVLATHGAAHLMSFLMLQDSQGGWR